METRHLQIFTAVYRTLSFTRAAGELFTSQPTVSEHIKNLEELLGCRLFDRLGRSIAPTPEADLLYPRAMEILAEMKELETTLAASARTVSGKVIIGASTIPGEYVLPQRAAQFRERYPEISFEILIRDSAQVIDDVESHRLHLGVAGVAQPSERLEFTPFDGDELVLAAAQEMSIPGELEAAGLQAYEFLNRERGSGTGRMVEHFLGSVGVATSDLQIRAILGSSTAIKEAIKAGLGIGFISRTAIADELARRTLKAIRIKGLSMKRSFYVVTPVRRTLPYPYLLFRDFLTSRD